QIQIRYEPVEDRIVMRMNTEDSSEFRFWVTRRYAQLLAVSLTKLLRSTDDLQEHKEERVQKAVMSFKHEVAISKADFAKTFEAQPKSLPLGNVPVLLSKLTVKQNDDGNPMLCMYPEQGQGIDLALQQQLLHSISKLFADALQASDWGVEFSLPDNNSIKQDSEKPVFLN
ncbi:MAG: hypothetical protein KAJ95_08025, partial [Gammaproteobacteria bacterium]|nr:hypothetical protein [Gammaproteobacteria bacterium]